MSKLAIRPSTGSFFDVWKWDGQKNTQTDFATLGLNRYRGQCSESHEDRPVVLLCSQKKVTENQQKKNEQVYRLYRKTVKLQFTRGYFPL